MDITDPRIHSRKLQTYFTQGEVNYLLGLGLVVEGNKGGLLLGPMHAQRGIPVLMQSGDYFEIVCELEGYEYIWGPATWSHHGSAFYELNRPEEDKLPVFTPYLVPGLIRQLDAHATANPYGLQSKFLLFGEKASFCVFNKYSTTKNLWTLDSINARVITQQSRVVAPRRKSWWNWFGSTPSTNC